MIGTRAVRCPMTAKTLGFLFLALVLVDSALAQGVRSHTRLTPRGTTVSETQAVDLTLTLTQVTVRPIQVWIRTAGVIDKAGKVITAYLSPRDAAAIKVGQRARTFPVESRSSMFQAFVSRVVAEGRRVRVDVTLAGPAREKATNYLAEIVTDRGDFLSIPNEAIIEEGDKRVAYVQGQGGQYEPREIRTGMQGELYTQINQGLADGDQVVTFGSFFIDSEYKLKGTAEAGR
jgi:multidrug efflux pump subunit AcrA (membrane-fusion protein)